MGAAPGGGGPKVGSAQPVGGIFWGAFFVFILFVFCFSFFSFLGVTSKWELGVGSLEPTTFGVTGFMRPGEKGR